MTQEIVGEWNIIHRETGKYLDAKDQRPYLNLHREGDTNQIWKITQVDKGYQIQQVSSKQVLDAGGIQNEIYTNKPEKDNPLHPSHRKVKTLHPSHREVKPLHPSYIEVNPFQEWEFTKLEGSDFYVIFHRQTGKFIESTSDSVYLTGYIVGNTMQEWVLRKPI